VDEDDDNDKNLALDDVWMMMLMIMRIFLWMMCGW
jgi:hypothetical protein